MNCWTCKGMWTLTQSLMEERLKDAAARRAGVVDPRSFWVRMAKALERALEGRKAWRGPAVVDMGASSGARGAARKGRHAGAGHGHV